MTVFSFQSKKITTFRI